MQISTGASGTLIEALRGFMADERGFLRLYLSPEDEGGGGAPDQDDDEPAAPAEPDKGKGSDSKSVENPELKRLSDENARRRIEAKKAREEAEAARKEAAEAKDLRDRLLKAIDPDADTSGDANEAAKLAQEKVEAAQKEAAEARRLAKIESAFLRTAIAKEMDPKRVDKAFRLADLGSVEVDDDGTIVGVDEAVDASLEEFPEWHMTANNRNRKPPPEVDNGAPGGNSDSSIDLTKLKPGDWSKLPEKQKRKLLDEGITFVEPPQFPGDEPRRIHFQTGGNEASQRIRKHMKGSDPLIGDVTGVGGMGSANKD